MPRHLLSTPSFSSVATRWALPALAAAGVAISAGHGRYDVKEFAAIHRGGTKVLQAAGNSMELFWQQSGLHTRSGPSETLEGLRIGNLRQEDFDRMQDVKEKLSTALQKFFFVEGVSAPEVDSDAFELKISGVSERGGEAALSLADLKTRFKQHQVTTTIRCATPRAADASSVQAVTQTPAEWTGVLLADVASVGVTSTEDIVEVRFEALDADKQGRPFGASFPATTALDREVGVLLAYEMDGACIPKEHGFLLRVVVPGSTGARNVKFVHRIVVV
ncbi:Eukaryotic molybdopterin oxidoreductase [Phytophthora cactorum]|nr:Eukaryotic molybdopterin oxidoreductase [Phytophthora cactorum]